MQTITLPSFKNVVNTYCGTEGCACGCNGTYAAPFHSDANSWTVRSDRTAKMRLNKLIKAYETNPSLVSVFPGLDNQMIWEYVYGEYNTSGERRVIRIYATKEDA